MKTNEKPSKTPATGDSPRGIDGIESFMIKRGLPLDRDTYLTLYFMPEVVPDPIPEEILQGIPAKYRYDPQPMSGK